MDSLKPAERRLISYGADLAVRVDARQGEQRGRFRRVVARGGVLTSEREERSQRVYRVRNEDTSARTVVIEHPLRPGWTLADSPKPEEVTATVARFRIPVAAKGEASLTVTEGNRSETTVGLATLVGSSFFEVYVESGIPTDTIQKALQPVVEKQKELVAAQDRLGRLQQEVSILTVDQNRVRDNMRALRGSKEEKALTQRYVKDLATQEDRLVTLRTSIVAAEAEQETVRAALDQLLERVEFDLTGP
jgi:hypothetical protein